MFARAFIYPLPLFLRCSTFPLYNVLYVYITQINTLVRALQKTIGGQKRAEKKYTDAHVSARQAIAPCTYTLALTVCRTTTATAATKTINRAPEEKKKKKAAAAAAHTVYLFISLMSKGLGACKFICGFFYFRIKYRINHARDFFSPFFF